MDLVAQMRTFVRIVEGRSLSTAARAQRLSLAAVSRQLGALEADLGASLVTRTTRRLAVTEAGQRFYEHAVRILTDLERARSSVSASRGIEGTLTVSAPITLGQAFVVPPVHALLAANPRLRVQLRLEDRAVDLVADGVDVAVRGGGVPPDSASIVARPILTFRRIAVASPSYVKRHGSPKDPAELARHDCLAQIGMGGTLDEWRLVSGAEERSVRVRHRLQCTAPFALRDAAIAGAGIALVGDWLTTDALRARRLVRVLPGWESAPVTVWAIHRVEARGSARVRAFVEQMQAHAKVRA